MEILEQTLVDINTQMNDAIHKQKLTVAKTITRVAEDTIHACMTHNDEYRDTFPEITELESNISTKTDKPFNPICVIEVKDGKGSQIIRTWDKTTGILPNRKVMGKYYIDVGKEHESFYHSPNAMYCVVHKKVAAYTLPPHTFLCTNAPISIGINCGCGNIHTHMNNHLFGAKLVTSKSIERGEHRQLFDTIETHEFEIDNYLNLYHPVSELYILFNKTSYPAFPFLARPNIFQSKRITGDSDTMQFKFDKTKYNSRDTEPTIIASTPELIPDDYYKIVDFYDRFRRMNSYKRNIRQLGTRNILFNTPENTDAKPDKTNSTPETGFSAELDTSEETVMDMRDKLIRELESRLSICLKQLETTDEYNSKLEDLYTKQSAEVLDLTRRVNLLTAKKNTSEVAKHLQENQEIFTLKKQLADAQSYIARCQILGNDIGRLESQLTECNLQTQKQKDLVKGLTEQLLKVKHELRDKSEEHSTGIKVAARNLTKITNLEKQNDTLTQNNITLQDKVRTLESHILVVNTHAKPDKEALEQILIVKCNELTAERDDLVKQNTEMQKTNKQLERNYEEFRGSITKLMTGCT